MKVFLCTMFSLLVSGSSIACVCGYIKEINEYDYIAVVEIEGVKKSELLEPNQSNKLPRIPMFYEVLVKTVDQYKGEHNELITIHGGNRKYDLGYTSCDLNISIGEQWIIYGEIYKGKMATSFCTMSTRHRNEYHEIDHQRGRSTKAILDLNNTLRANVNEIKDGPVRTIYPNQTTESIACYEKGKLEDVRQVYYSNGQLMLDEYYINDLKSGASFWYHRNGKIKRKCIFKQGKMVDKCRFYNRNGQLTKINHFDSDGNFLFASKIK